MIFVERVLGSLNIYMNIRKFILELEELTVISVIFISTSS